LESTDEEIRIVAIKRYIEGEKQVDIYESLGKSKSWLKKWIKHIFRTLECKWTLAFAAIKDRDDFCYKSKLTRIPHPTREFCCLFVLKSSQ